MLIVAVDWLCVSCSVWTELAHW